MNACVWCMTSIASGRFCGKSCEDAYEREMNAAEASVYDD